ncbi:Uncharacterised protein [Mycobacteroides abscessus subsp. abscessus]|uniref:Uncharacterized protein n=1 Tax=Mycobacteroides abscessus TaxID=36809 RepID=A0A0U0ZNY4_9MYCO|nr:hypothetical protein D2E33_06560 [Mycobacteroides abscessus]SHU54129.1 Uncharacterised protein [Mycobacteroides abscessus subsp. abscessus]SKL84722.1 Uncharacterised protein [Mycobacteroides abscessus subsp. massiliense]RIT70950.1 hypothetical protein D2E87_11330 [Mycobacteroides abscessus]CPV60649.1 Uncharacterised protein [Mycobacteroides abscessus]
MNETRRSLLVSSEWSTIAEHPVAELKEAFAVMGARMSDDPDSFLKGWDSFGAAKAAFARS